MREPWPDPEQSYEFDEPPETLAAAAFRDNLALLHGAVDGFVVRCSPDAEAGAIVASALTNDLRRSLSTEGAQPPEGSDAHENPSSLLPAYAIEQALDTSPADTIANLERQARAAMPTGEDNDLGDRQSDVVHYLLQTCPEADRQLGSFRIEDIGASDVQLSGDGAQALATINVSAIDERVSVGTDIQDRRPPDTRAKPLTPQDVTLELPPTETEASRLITLEALSTEEASKSRLALELGSRLRGMAETVMAMSRSGMTLDDISKSLERHEPPAASS